MLLIVLNKPSRFDLPGGGLITGNAGVWFDNQLRRNGLTRANTPIWTAERFINNGLQPPTGTKAVLFLGEQSFRIKHPDNRVSLNELRGYPYQEDYIWLSSYAPQDAMDIKDYEGQFNSDGEMEKEAKVDSESDLDIKSHGKTRRKNYRFWLSMDLAKIIRLMREGLKQKSLGFTNEIYPNSELIESTLTQAKNQNIYFDIETDPKSKDITVFSYSINGGIVYTVPVRRYDYTGAYITLELCRIFRALAVAFRDNTIITHNGHGFDFFVTGFKYKIPFGENHYDTMIAHHRLYPEVEKSLGHCLSLYTDEPYHKNESDGGYVPWTSEQEKILWKYNAKDVAVLPFLHKSLQEKAKQIGAEVSIQDAMDLIPAYLTLSFRGIKVDSELIAKRMEENNRRVIQLLRVLKILVGRDINPQSPPQMKKYFFQELKIKPVGYTETGAPSCDEKALLKIGLKQELPVIPVVLEIRKTGKLTSMMEFESI